MKLKYMNPMPPSWWKISAWWQVDILYISGYVCTDAGSRGHLWVTWILQENGLNGLKVTRATFRFLVGYGDQNKVR